MEITQNCIRKNMSYDLITRHFETIDEGQIHFRQAGKQDGRPPLILLHGQPSSSVSMEPLMRALAPHRFVIAPDTLGMGDSSQSLRPEPEISDFANAVDQLCQKLGYSQVDLYGFHTGAHIGIEMAVASPENVRKLIIDGLAIFSDEQKNEFLKNYAPAMTPSNTGAQFNWAWNFVRDQMIFFPHFKKDSAHMRSKGDFDPVKLHQTTVEVLKRLETYHLPYRAAFMHDVERCLPLLNQPTLCLRVDSDPLSLSVERSMSLLKQGQIGVVEGENRVSSTASAIVAYLASS